MFDHDESDDAPKACPFCGGGRCDHLLLEVDDYDCELKGGHQELFEHVVAGRPVDVFALIRARWNKIAARRGPKFDYLEKKAAFEEFLYPIWTASDGFVQFDIDSVPGLSWTPVRFYVAEARRTEAIKKLYRRFRPASALQKRSRGRRGPEKASRRKTPRRKP